MSRWPIAWVLVAATAFGSVPSHARARTPLPTIEVVQPERRVRVLDVRGAVRAGWGWSSVWNGPVYAVGLEGQISFVELTRTTWLHLSVGNSFVLPPRLPSARRSPRGLAGADVGLGLSRYAPEGPAFIVTVSGGPRWMLERGGLPPDGVGALGRAELYPFYRSMPQLVTAKRNWLADCLVGGLHGWVSVRYDLVVGRHTHGVAGGLGLDFARALLLPAIAASHSRGRNSITASTKPSASGTSGSL